VNKYKGKNCMYDNNTNICKRTEPIKN
jgi:hypothetical protein